MNKAQFTKLMTQLFDMNQLFIPAEMSLAAWIEAQYLRSTGISSIFVILLIGDMGDDYIVMTDRDMAVARYKTETELAKQSRAYCVIKLFRVIDGERFGSDCNAETEAGRGGELMYEWEQE